MTARIPPLERALAALLKQVPRNALLANPRPGFNVVIYSDAEWKLLCKATTAAEIALSTAKLERKKPK